MMPRAELRSAVRQAARVRVARAALRDRLVGWAPRYALTVLAVAAHPGPVTAAELAKLTGTTPRTARRIADELVDRGTGFLDRHEEPAGTARYDLAAPWLAIVRDEVAKLDPEPRV